eukprot:484733_1
MGSIATHLRADTHPRISLWTIWMMTLLCFDFMQISVNASIITPNISNATGEYYYLTNDADYSKNITCGNPSGCYIICGENDACKTSSINAIASNILDLVCSGSSSCDSMNLISGPINTANIQCISPSGLACKSATFTMSSTNNINVECDTDTTLNTLGNCYYINIHAENAHQVNINCAGRYDCRFGDFHLGSVSSTVTINGNGYGSLNSANVYAANSNKLVINCNNGYSCYLTNIEPPYSQAYAFILFCTSVPYSCSTVDISVPSSLAITNNYMELICGRSPYFNDNCEVGWICPDLSTGISTFTTYIYGSYSSYQCNDNDCCPWTDPNSMLQLTTKPETLPNSIQPTISNSTGEWYI